MWSVLTESLTAWWPETVLASGALAGLVAGAWTRRSQPALTLAWVTLAVAAVGLWRAPVTPSSVVFFGMIVCDPFAYAVRWLALGATVLVLLLVMGSREVEAAIRGEYYGLLLLLSVGLMLMAEANHLLTAYLAMELVSLSSYALAGFLTDVRAAEGSLKYLLFGALASAIMLFGMSLLFGLTGTLSFPQLARSLAELPAAAQRAAIMAATFMVVGLGYKISLVPFHLWTPDVYEGAPVPVAALFSVGPKAAGLALFVRAMEALAPAGTALLPLLLTLTIVTMTLGNLLALVQTNVKRLLAYSTIGQVGYLMIGLVVHSSAGREALLVYLVAYLFMNVGAFACVTAVVNDSGSESLDAFRGLARRSPGLALCCAIFLLSLAGLPPMLGFFGKFLLFGAALQAGHSWLALAGILNSAIALYYYVNIIRQMYLLAPQHTAPVDEPLPLRLAIAVCVVATLAVGVLPGTLLQAVRAAATVHLL